MRICPVNPNLQFRMREDRPLQRSTQLDHSSSITFGASPQQASFFDSIYDALATFFASLLAIFGLGAVTLSDVSQLATKHGFIYFYNHKNTVSAWLGNFYPSPIKIYGRSFTCAEAAYQMCKFKGHKQLQAQFETLNGDQAFQLARKNSTLIRSDWNFVKEKVMEEVLYAKFTQNKHLQSLLLATLQAFIVEHNEVVGRDTYWSNNHDGTGQNRLGELLMDLRAKLGGAGTVPAPQNYYAFLRKP